MRAAGGLQCVALLLVYSPLAEGIESVLLGVGCSWARAGRAMPGGAWHVGGGPCMGGVGSLAAGWWWTALLVRGGPNAGGEAGRLRAKGLDWWAVKPPVTRVEPA
jgi:hypothetical protein